MKYLLLLLGSIFIVSSHPVKAQTVSDEVKMLIDISNNVSSIKTQLNEVDKKFTEIKSNMSTLELSLKTVGPRISVLEEWRVSIDKGVSEIKTLEDKFVTLDKLNSSNDAKISVYWAIAIFIASSVATVLLGQFLTRKKRK